MKLANRQYRELGVTYWGMCRKDKMKREALSTLNNVIKARNLAECMGTSLLSQHSGGKGRKISANLRPT